MYSEIENQENNLQRLFKKADNLKNLDGFDTEVRAQFTWYLCVRTSGYIEISIKVILHEYAKSYADSYTANYVSSQLKFSRNPKKQQIAELLGKFSPSWKDSFNQQTKGNIGESLDSIVNNRNAIAHGNNVNLTFSELERYFNDAKKAVNILFKLCKSHSPNSNN